MADGAERGTDCGALVHGPASEDRCRDDARRPSPAPTTAVSPTSELIDTGGSLAAQPARRRVLPGGVTGAGRVENPYPVVFVKGRGARLWDVDGNEFIDYHCGYGSAFLGYGHPAVNESVTRAIAEDRSFVGCAHVYESALAERLVAMLPEAEMVAFSGGGGTDGLYNAIRIARSVTGREKLVKIEGGYQGWHGVLGGSTSPALDDPAKIPLPQTIANSAGTLAATIDALRVVNANDLDSLRARFELEGDQIAALVLEPILYSAGVVAIEREYLALARELCDAYGSVLIFDEVVSGFRLALGGAGALLAVTPDLAVYGKAIANGHVISVLAGRRELIEVLTPTGAVFYSGTFNGHPLACAAIDATLNVLTGGEAFAHAARLARATADGVNAAIGDAGVTAVCQQVGPLWNLYFNATEIRDYRDLAAISDPRTLAANQRLRHHLREHGIFMQHRKGTNRAFVTAAHTQADVDKTVEVIAGFLGSGAIG